jgi:hypothetical protein
MFTTRFLTFAPTPGHFSCRTLFCVRFSRLEPLCKPHSNTTFALDAFVAYAQCKPVSIETTTAPPPLLPYHRRRCREQFTFGSSVSHRCPLATTGSLWNTFCTLIFSHISINTLYSPTATSTAALLPLLLYRRREQVTFGSSVPHRCLLATTGSLWNTLCILISAKFQQNTSLTIPSPPLHSHCRRRREQVTSGSIVLPSVPLGHRRFALKHFLDFDL